jgi:hypothetical protein
MSQRRVKQTRRVIRKAREVIIHDSFDRTLGLPLRDRLEVALAIVTRRKSWLVGLYLVALLVSALVAVVAWIS